MKEDTRITGRLLSVAAGGNYKGMSIHTLYTMVRQRHILYVKLGRLI